MAKLQQFREPEVRRRFGAILAAKVVGIAGVLGAVKLFGFFFSDVAGASPLQGAAEAANTINPLNTVWVLVTAFLVFFMQAGFMVLEAGFARGRETVNILLEGIVDTALC